MGRLEVVQVSMFTGQGIGDVVNVYNSTSCYALLQAIGMHLPAALP